MLHLYSALPFCVKGPITECVGHCRSAFITAEEIVKDWHQWRDTDSIAVTHHACKITHGQNDVACLIQSIGAEAGVFFMAPNKISCVFELIISAPDPDPSKERHTCHSGHGK